MTREGHAMLAKKWNMVKDPVKCMNGAERSKLLQAVLFFFLGVVKVD